ncbi:MAG: hypothetical protein GEV28_07415 [Actinophytocola sp.]|uniref:hypothetical protein n=1 Tax=Actinophytocola sp. TaxID=1872138 RepID=UPI001322753B|nr:hypothetical protein [Actinophytocola sp.]MPZ80219.1 hypothetical protein [Actinophytocola sp.]
MSFVESVVAEPDELAEPRVDRHRALPPRQTVLPASLPWERVLARGTDVRVTLGPALCWPEHLTIEVGVYASRPPRGREEFLPMPGGVLGEVDRAHGGLRLAALFSDGRYATNLRGRGYHRPAGRGLSAEFPVLSPRARRRRVVGASGRAVDGWRSERRTRGSVGGG